MRDGEVIMNGDLEMTWQKAVLTNCRHSSVLQERLT